MTNDKGIYNN